MGQTDEADEAGKGGIRQQNRQQIAGRRGGKGGPGRHRKAPPGVRYVGWSRKKGHRYQPVSRVNGRHVYGETGTYDEAREAAANAATRAKASAGVKFVEFEEACQAVLDSVKAKPGTWRSYCEHFVTLSDYFGADTPLHEVDRNRIKAFVEHRRAARHRGKPVGELRIRKNLTALGRVFSLAILNDQFSGQSPLDKIELPKVQPRESGHYSVDELQTIISTMRAQRWRTVERSWRIVAALAFSGLRRAEFCRLRAGQVDLAGGMLRDIGGKTNVVSLPITKPLAAVLAHLVEGLAPDETIVPAGEVRGPRVEGNAARTDQDRREGKLNGLFRRFRAVLPERLRDRFHPHTMRHTLSTILADGGVPDHVCNKLTRHTDPRSSARYKHVSPLLLRTEAQRVLDPLLYLVEQVQPAAVKAQA